MVYKAHLDLSEGIGGELDQGGEGDDRPAVRIGDVHRNQSTLRPSATTLEGIRRSCTPSENSTYVTVRYDTICTRYGATTTSPVCTCRDHHLHIAAYE